MCIVSDSTFYTTHKLYYKGMHIWYSTYKNIIMVMAMQEIKLFNTAWQISITSTYPKSFNMTMWLQLAQKTVEECMH